MIRSTIYWVDTGDWLEDERKALREAGVDVVVSLLTRAEQEELDLLEERRFCEAAGMAFVSLPIDDRAIPDSDARALGLISRLERFVVKGKTVGIHCRMGIGRSSMIAAGVLVMLGVNGDRAFELLAAARGLAVPDTERQRQWALQLRKSAPGTE